MTLRRRLARLEGRPDGLVLAVCNDSPPEPVPIHGFANGTTGPERLGRRPGEVPVAFLDRLRKTGRGARIVVLRLEDSNL